ncbi:hypothetical protein BCR36DRAFT_145974 [Piromyces finnis]|uniref:Uncharacterized protein n=1 Tax=Piromyces finnis TaxID=1754191 RepID=A0A1Y1UZP0_9FUNG|nr:hypothetical protein BCR36DRAFT_145974 [Piromyces finnis]|eukprot:ORX43283.1 hypothetical protein BCR36DRAFT_145974 [Piromyces finnis]
MEDIRSSNDNSSNLKDLDYTKISYKNKNEIIDILKKLMEITKLIEEWSVNNVQLNQTVMSKSVIKDRSQTAIHEILLKIYAIASDIKTKINNIEYEEKEELILLSETFELINSAVEMFEKEYSLKETIVSDILNRILKKDEIETNYALLSNEPYINYEELTMNLKQKNEICQILIKSS